MCFCPYFLQVKAIPRSLSCLLVFVSMCLVFVPDSAAQGAYRWKNVAIGGGSYVTGIVFHPEEEGLVYIQTDIGGCYRWDEADTQWIPITDHFPESQRKSYVGQSIAIDPRDPDVVYIAVRDGTLLKSTDRGNTWTKLKLDVPMGASIWWCTEPLAVDPFDSKVILYVSANRELFKSVNGGVSWKSKGQIAGPGGELGILGVMFDPASRGKVYMNSFENGIYQSLDAGDSWTLLKDSPKGVLKMSLNNDGTLYTAGRIAPKVAKKNRDGTWADLTPQKYKIGSNAPPSTRRALADFNFCGISVDPANPNHIVLSLDYKTPNKILHSLNGGASWSEVKPVLNHTVPWWPKQWWGGGVSAVKCDPHVPGQVWFTDFKGIWRTDNIYAQPSVWTNPEKGHEEIYVTCLIAPPAAGSTSGYMLISGAADVDGFTHYNLDCYPDKKNGPPSYQFTLSMDYCANNPVYIVRVGESWALNALGDFIVPELDPNPFGGSISVNEGRTWKAFAALPISQGVITRVAMSADDPDIIIAVTGDGPVYRTADGANSWQKIDTLPDKGLGGKGYWDNRHLLAADRVNGRKFYYYTDGKLYRSTDAGLTFAPTAASLPPLSDDVRKERIGNDVKAAPWIEGEVWAGFDSRGLYRSSDSGSSFSKLKNVDKVLLFDFGRPLNRTSPPIVYLYGTVNGKDGIFRSLDFGEKWHDITPAEKIGIGCDPRVMEASKQHCGLVFVGTNGRGIYYGVPDDFSAVR